MKSLRCGSFHFLILFLLSKFCSLEAQLSEFDIRNLSGVTEIKLSELGFSDIEYIPLETNQSCLLTRITDLRAVNDFFLVQYFTTIFKFDKTGKFITKIGTEGRGPNEFTVVHDVDIDPKNGNIYLVSGWQRKFFVYSKDGRFLRTFQSPVNTTHFRVTDNGILCYSINTFSNIDWSFNLIDTTGRLIKRFANYYRWNLTHKYAFVFQHENIFYRFNNMLFKKEVYSDTVYLFDNYDFKPHLIINAGQRLITPELRTELAPEQIMEKYISPINIFEFGSFIYYEFVVNRSAFGFIGLGENSFKRLFNLDQGFVNDLDCGPNIHPVTTWDDNTIISWIDALDLKKHIASEIFRNSKPKYPEKKVALEKLADGLNETDNPVLVIIRLKE